MASPLVPWKLGIEIELLAPPGLTRRDLAEAIARRLGSAVRRCFHRQGEPSKVPGTPVFENLTLGFEVVDGEDRCWARCVDDLTLQDDLDRHSSPRSGWYRIVSDDPRLLGLVSLHADPEAPLERVLEPIAALFGVSPQTGTGGMVRVADERGAPIALGAPLPGERERPCELITPPIEVDHHRRLEELLEPARRLGFTAPLEGAVHLHFDASPLCQAGIVANLVRFWNRHGPALKSRFGSNPRCRRLGEWPRSLTQLVSQPDFSQLAWPQARTRLAELDLTKYCDFNLRNLIHPNPEKHTVELRTLPVHLEAAPILAAAATFAKVLHWASAGQGRLEALPEDLEELIPES